MSETIQRVTAEEITDSRGKPTVLVTVATESHEGSFAVPSGASTGSTEAIELRDADGGMDAAIEKITGEIADALRGMPVDDQRKIDETMIALDGTPNKSRLGGNSMIGVSIAATRAAASAAEMPLYEYLRTKADIPASRKEPLLFVNLINGGKHAEGGSPIQEHQIIPQVDTAREGLQIAEQVEQALHQNLAEAKVVFTIGDEGGVVYPVGDITEPFAAIRTAAERAGVLDAIALGADSAASSFFNETVGEYELLGGEKLSANALQERYSLLHREYGLHYLEDPFEEHAFTDFASLLSVEPEFIVIGDDLTTTARSRITEAAGQKAINAVIIKPNQVGTLTETLDAMAAAREHGVHCVVSHRSGETMDSFVADLAYAFGCLGLKAGAPSKPERMVKYQRLLDITYDTKN